MGIIILIIALLSGPVFAQTESTIDWDAALVADSALQEQNAKETVPASPDSQPLPDSISSPDSPASAHSQTVQGSAPVKDSVRLSVADSLTHAQRLRATTIYAPKQKVQTDLAGYSKLNRTIIRDVIGLQNDALRAVTLVSGVSNENDVSVRPFVRGGKSDETVINWNNIRVMQPYHFGSMYSLFNAMSVENMEVYKTGFPADQPSSLSGVVSVQTRIPSADSLEAELNFDSNKGSIYLSSPVIKNRVTAWLAWQSFWYDKVIEGTLNFLNWVQDNEDLEKSVKALNEMIDLPDFRDLQYGLMAQVTPKLNVLYEGLYAQDIFNVYSQKNAYLINGKEVSPDYWRRHGLFWNDGTDVRKAGIIKERQAGVNVDNHIQSIHSQYVYSPNWTFTQNFAVQNQQWDTQILASYNWVDSITPNNEFAGYKDYSSSNLVFDLNATSVDGRLAADYYGKKNHILTTGVAFTYFSQKYTMQLPRLLFDLIYYGKLSTISYLHELNAKGFVLVDDPNTLSLRDVMIMQEFVDRQWFEEKGNYTSQQYSVFAEDKYEKGNQLLRTGVRAEVNTDGNWFISPRVTYTRTLSAIQRITLSSGLYSDPNHSLIHRMAAGSKSLLSEKNGHVHLEWYKELIPGLDITIMPYAKYYWDLVYLQVDNGSVDWLKDTGMDWDLDSVAYDTLPSDAQDMIDKLFGERKFIPKQTGTGFVYGIEWEINHTIGPVRNALRVDALQSRRKDTKEGIWYEYDRFFPWSFDWSTTLNLPNDYQFAVRMQSKSGPSYTPYYSASDIAGTTTTTGDTLLYVGKRNSARLDRLVRWDLRINHGSTIFGHPVVYYTEVWNFLNYPNFMSRDKEEKTIQAVELNYPFPTIFIGMKTKL